MLLLHFSQRRSEASDFSLPLRNLCGLRCAVQALGILKLCEEGLEVSNFAARCFELRDRRLELVALLSLL